jgi:hypothetical protein
MTAGVLTPTPEPPSPQAVPAARRGELTLQPRVVVRLTARSIELHSDCPEEPAVQVRESSPDHLELEASLVLVYPDEPLAPSLNRLREQVTADVERLTGRPVRRLDLRVERFVATPRPARRVE